MAKMSYQIPAGIDRSFLDHEISLTNNGMLKPVPLKQILFYLCAVLVLVWICMATFVRQAGAGWMILVVGWGIAAAAYLGMATKTKQLKLMTVPVVAAYVPPSARTVMTRQSSMAAPFHTIAGIENVDMNGWIHYSDGGAGRLYAVVGTASALLFEDDQVAIIDRVGAWWRKADPGCEWIWITTSQPQRVHRQIAALEQRNQELGWRDPDLVELMDEQYDILTKYVGGQFQSLHQYLLVRGRTPDALRRGELLVRAETEGSALMLREAHPMGRDDVLAMLRSVYAGEDVIDPLEEESYVAVTVQVKPWWKQATGHTIQ